MAFPLRRLTFAGAILCVLIALSAARAEDPHFPAIPGNAGIDGTFPPAQTTRHVLELPGRALSFEATAGSIRVGGDDGPAQAELAFIAYQRDGSDHRTRPVTFVFNGGPGMASGWLQTGAIGPWRIAIGNAAGGLTAAPDLMANADTWLDFTDLVFIDPPGTGYSRILATGDDARRRLWSVNGDNYVLAQAMRRWLDRNDRLVSPIIILGESYGGFRAPRLARALQSEEGVRISGLVLISPVLDTHVLSGYNDPLGWVDRLPTEVAAARALKGPVSRADLADVEQYATTAFLTDLLLGMRDTAAVARITDRVAALTGIDRAIVARGYGRLDSDVFLHELDRARGRVGSAYDATVTSSDPNPREPDSRYPDPVLQGLKAPVTAAMMTIYTHELNWRPDRTYYLADDEVARRWNWGDGVGRPESLSSLQSALALDPNLRVLVAHGLFDLVTPYFTTVRLLGQMPDAAAAERITLAVWPGGHMFYTQDASRAAFHDTASAMFSQAVQ